MSSNDTGLMTSMPYATDTTVSFLALGQRDY